MALITLGTAATNSLNALVYQRGVSQTDIAQIAANIKGQANPTHPIVPGGFNSQGIVYLPGHRGIIRLKPGDYVGYDNFGWPIVVSSESIASGSSWTHS